MQRHDIFDIPLRYRLLQIERAKAVGKKLGIQFQPSDVFMLATAQPSANTDQTLDAISKQASDRSPALMFNPRYGRHYWHSRPDENPYCSNRRFFKLEPIVKNSQLLVTKADIHDYVGTLWQTDAFHNYTRRTALFSMSWTNSRSCRAFSAKARTTNSNAPHFSTWWGAVHETGQLHQSLDC